MATNSNDPRSLGHAHCRTPDARTDDPRLALLDRRGEHRPLFCTTGRPYLSGLPGGSGGYDAPAHKPRNWPTDLRPRRMGPLYPAPIRRLDSTGGSWSLQADNGRWSMPISLYSAMGQRASDAAAGTASSAATKTITAVAQEADDTDYPDRGVGWLLSDARRLRSERDRPASQAIVSPYELTATVSPERPNHGPSDDAGTTTLTKVDQEPTDTDVGRFARW